MTGPKFDILQDCKSTEGYITKQIYWIISCSISNLFWIRSMTFLKKKFVKQMLSTRLLCICSRRHDQRPNPETRLLFWPKLHIRQNCITSQGYVTKLIHWIALFLTWSMSWTLGKKKVKVIHPSLLSCRTVQALNNTISINSTTSVTKLHHLLETDNKFNTLGNIIFYS